MTRRSVWQMIVACWRTAQQERDKRVYESGVRRGRQEERAAIDATMRPVFGERPVYIPVAMLPSYEPPERTTEGHRPVQQTAKLLPLENVIGPHQTQSLPAVDPQTGYYQRGHHPLMRKATKFWESQRRVGK